MIKFFQILVLFISLGSIVNAIDITVSSSSDQNTWYSSNINGNININSITTFSWDSGVWSACNASCGGGTKTRTVVCKGSDDIVYSDSLCSGEKPSTSEACNNSPCYTYGWDEGSWGACDASPSWDEGSWGACDASPSWDEGSWGACSASCGGGTQSRTVTCSGTSGTQSRTVTCIRSDGNTVIDGFCGGGKPSSSQSCTESCSGTAPSSSQSCTESCSGTTPSSSQSCNTQSCSVDCVGEYDTCDSCSSPGAPSGGSGWYNGTKTCSLTNTVTPASGGGNECPSTMTKTCQVWKNSFIEGTLVKLVDGTTKNIENIIVGDILKGSNNSKNTVLELKFHPHQGDLYAINGSEYFVTPGHPFMTLDGWKAFDEKLAMQINPTMQIKKLMEGDVLVKENSLEIIQSISTIPTNIQVYNFEVSGTKDYYANGYLVHNK